MHALSATAVALTAAAAAATAGSFCFRVCFNRSFTTRLSPPPPSLSTAYFSGKMLAKMGRIALIADEMGRPDDARMVAARLAEASQVRQTRYLQQSACSLLLASACCCKRSQYDMRCHVRSKCSVNSNREPNLPPTPHAPSSTPHVWGETERSSSLVHRTHMTLPWSCSERRKMKHIVDRLTMYTCSHVFFENKPTCI